MIRKYGNTPYKAAVIHGGPGAPGYMAPVARELCKTIGTIEPIQTAKSLEGQLFELHDQITNNCSEPICLIGSSWGAALSLFYAAKFHETVQKVVLIGSCVYDENSSQKVKEIRAKRMSEGDKQKSKYLSAQLANATESEKNAIFGQLADCLFATDTFDPISRNLEIIGCELDTNKLVWADFKLIRDTPGELKKIFSKIDVPVANIHGDYDPHVIEGIQPFLESYIGDIKLHVLEKCGHYPWIEKEAKDNFYEILRAEVAQ